MKSRGFTLIELVVAVVVVGIAFYAIISVFISVLPRSVNVEDLARATYLANRVMEETTVRDFSVIASVPATSFSAPFDSFRYQIIVDYVTTAEPDVVWAEPTPYKKVTVKTWGGLSGTVEVTTLVTSYAH